MRFSRRNKAVLSLAAALVIFLIYLSEGRTGGEPAVIFLGGAGEVGGSCTLVDNGRTSFLVDCGALGSAGRGVLPDDPSGISFVLLTHAHSDHCGLLPELFEKGFNGPVYCTAPTGALVPVILRMSRNFSRIKVKKDHFDRALESIVKVGFDEWKSEGGIDFRFRPAGHLLGASFIEIDTGDGNERIRIVFSGDLGSGSSLLIPPLEVCEEADYVIMESTYGGTIKESMGKDPAGRHACFAESVAEALKNGGDVLVPAFTMGRTQDVMAVLDLYIDKGIIPGSTEIYVDSPTARKISEIYREYESWLSPWANSFYGGNALRSPSLREVRSRTSMKVHSRKHRPSVFISSSGDLRYANSPRHLVRMFDRSENLLCLVGWQSPGSTGWRLENGEDPVLVMHREGKELVRDWISPLIETRRFSSFSSHADQNALIDWLSDIDRVKKVFLVHGEPDQAEALASRIDEEMDIDVSIPRSGESFRLESRK